MTDVIPLEDQSPNALTQLRARLADLEGEVLQLKARPVPSIDSESVFENATDGFLVYDSEFHFTYSNRDVERLLGKSKTELLGKSQWQVFPETIGTEIERQYRRAMTERVAIIFDSLYEPLKIWIEFRVSPSTTGGILVWLRDVTARRQAEMQREGLQREIQAERQVLGEIVEKAPVAISVMRAPDLTYELANPAFQTLASVKPILGSRFSDVWVEADDPLMASLRNVLATGIAFDTIDSPRTIQRDPDSPPETIFVTSSWIPLVGPSGSPDRILSLAVETTERKRQEDRLRSSEARLARAQKMANLGGWELDLEAGEIQISEDACTILGMPPEASRTSLEALLSLVHPEDELLVREAIHNAPAHEGCSQIDHRIILPDGTERFLRQYIEPLGREAGRGCLVGTVQDVTEYKHLEEKFRRAQRLEGIARLAAGVSHDFNNLLVVINGYAQMILSRLKPEDPLWEEAQEIIKAGNRAAALTRQLLVFSRKDAMRPQLVNLDTILVDLEKMLRRLIREDIEVKQNLTPGLWNVRADPAQVEQVVINLVVNARDAMPKGGVLTIGTSNVELGAQEIKGFTDLKPGRYVSLTVTDTGTGMTTETKRRLFEPFFTTKPSGEGTGLGLSMVYGIVKQHGGEVSFYSELGLGSTFRVFWPATDQARDTSATVSTPLISYQGSETILLVEDDESVRKLVRQMLLLRGYKVLETTRSSEAVDLAGKHSGPIDLLLTDVIMPQMGGHEIAAQVAALRPGIRVVFMSGYPGDPTVNDHKLEPPASFLQKPFEMGTLWQILRQVLGPGPSDSRVIVPAPNETAPAGKARIGTRASKNGPRMSISQQERHRIGRIGWLRAAVLGANDGILSTASLLLGVSTAHATHANVLIAGVAGLVAGTMSMAAGEYVSVHSQADTEHADLRRENTELEVDDEGEHKELAAIYVARGLDRSLAKQVAQQLMAYDALGAHARDELGITKTVSARPVQAALASAGSFAVGAALPLVVTAIAPAATLVPLVAGTSLAFLALLGGLAAHTGGARVTLGAMRVTFWGALAMAVTAGVGALCGTVV